MHLNPGNGLFQMSLNSEIYVDKSGLIAYTNHVLNTQQRFVCVSRPRRFGKSMAADMLAAYYGRGADSRGQFAGLAIAGDIAALYGGELALEQAAPQGLRAVVTLPW